MRITVVHKRSLEAIKVPAINNNFKLLQETCFDTDPDYFGAPSQVHFLKNEIDVIDCSLFRDGDYVYAANEEDASQHAVHLALSNRGGGDHGDSRARTKSEPGFKHRLSSTLSDAEKLLLLKRAIVKLREENENLSKEKVTAITSSRGFAERISELEREIEDMKCLVTSNADDAIKLLLLERSDGQSVSLDATASDAGDSDASYSYYSTDEEDGSDIDDDGSRSHVSSHHSGGSRRGIPRSASISSSLGGGRRRRRSRSHASGSSGDDVSAEEAPGVETISPRPPRHPGHARASHPDGVRKTASPRSAQRSRQRAKDRRLRGKLRRFGKRVSNVAHGRPLSFGLNESKPDPLSYMQTLNKHLTDLVVKIAVDKRKLSRDHRDLQSAVHAMKGDFDHMTTQLSVAQDRQQHTQKELDETREELAKQRHHVQTFMQALYKEQSQAENLRKANADLEKAVLSASKNAKCSACQSDKGNYHIPRAALQDQLREMEQKNHELTYMTQYLTRQVEETSKQLAERERKLISKTTQLAEARAALDALDSGDGNLNTSMDRARREEVEIASQNHDDKDKEVQSTLAWITSYLYKEKHKGDAAGSGQVPPNPTDASPAPAGATPAGLQGDAGREGDTQGTAGDANASGGYLSTWIPSFGFGGRGDPSSSRPLDAATSEAIANGEGGETGGDNDGHVTGAGSRPVGGASRSHNKRPLRRTASLTDLDLLASELDRGLYHGEPFVSNLVPESAGEGNRDRAQTHAK